MTKLAIMNADTLLATFEQTIDRVEAGETILVERDGAIVAELVPFSVRESPPCSGESPRSMMLPEPAILHLVCGKAGAGKSTLCASLASESRTLMVVQDDWMAALYCEELVEIADYIRLIPRLRAAIGPHLAALLRHGLSIVLDWPANTRETRAWMRQIAEAAGAEARLHWLDTDNAECLARVVRRNASGEHAFTLTPEQFDELGRWFEPPTADEGFTITRHAT